MAKKEKYYGIETLVDMKDEHHLYSVHPTNDENLISGYIETLNGKLVDWDTKEEYTEEDIWNISVWEEEHVAFYIKIL